VKDGRKSSLVCGRKPRPLCSTCRIKTKRRAVNGTNCPIVPLSGFLCSGRQTTLAALAGRRWRHLQLGVLGHHPLEPDSDTLDDGQQDGAADGAVADGFGSSAHGERTTGEETGNNGVPWVLLFANALDGAVECAEHATPDAEVATEYGRACLDCRDGWRGRECQYVIREITKSRVDVRWWHTSYSALAVRAVPVSFNTVPYCSTNCLSQSVRSSPFLSICASSRDNVLPCRMHRRNPIMRPMGRDRASGPDRVPRPL